MDADERLKALQKAYADIILNTAKEAAARIMVSERKAVRAQHELNVAKEQALQMLLRLKQMTDSKASEAGMTYLNQQKKIEVLKAHLQEAGDTINKAETRSLSQQRKIEETEAQLHEAEDIVKDLREELREVQAELERIRKNELQLMEERDTVTQEPTSQENRLNSSQSIIFCPPESRLESFPSVLRNSAFNKTTEIYKCYNEYDNHVGIPSIRRPDLHLTSASKDNSLNTSQSVLFPLSEAELESFKVSDMKNLSTSQGNEAHECYSVNGFSMGNSNSVKPELPSIILSTKKPEAYRNRRTQRIRAFEEKLMAGELSFSETVDDRDYETSGREEGGERKCQRPTQSSCHRVQKIEPVRRKRKRATGYKKSKTSSSRHLSNQTLKRVQTSDTSGTKANTFHNMAPSLSEDTTDKGTPLGCTKVIESVAELVKASTVEHATNNDKESVDDLLLTRQESGSTDSLQAPISRVDTEKVGVPAVNSLAISSGTTTGIANEPVTDRVIKYTFQRKRKKESLISSDGTAVLENNILKKMAAEKQDDPLETEKSGTIPESSRDSRRLAQVARQLISLSGKNWWQ